MPRPLTPEELAIVDLYSRCRLGMTPQEFYAKWQVNQEALACLCEARIATICSRSISTVRRWFAKGQHYRRPSREDLRHLAIADFLLEHYHEIPDHLRETLCPQQILEAEPTEQDER